MKALPARILSLFLVLALLTGPALFAAPKVSCNEWLNGAPKIKKIQVYWFLETLMTENNGEAAMNTLFEEYKDNPDVCIMGITSGASRVMKPWATANNIQFPVGCGVERKTHTAFAVLNWPTVVIVDPKGEMAWRGAPGGAAEGVKKILVAVQEADLPKAEKSVEKAQKYAADAKYADAYETYFKTLPSVSLLDLSNTIKKEMAYLEDLVVGGIDRDVFDSDAKGIKSVGGAVKRLIRDLEGSPLVPRLEQRQKLIDAAAGDDEMRLALQMAHVNRLFNTGEMNVAYKGMHQISEGLGDNEEMRAQVQAGMEKVERIVANRVRTLKNAGQDSTAVKELCEYFADTPMPAKIEAWLKEAAELEKVVANAPTETKAPEKATSFAAAAPANDYDNVPLPDLIANANAAYEKGTSLVKGLDGGNPNFNKIIEEASEAFMNSTQMLSAAVARSDGNVTELQGKLRDSRKQLFFCHKMARH